MTTARTPLPAFLDEALPATAEGRDLAALLLRVAEASRLLAAQIARGSLAAAAGAGTRNVHGEEQKPLDLVGNDIFLRTCAEGGLVAGMVSEELDEAHPLPEATASGRFLLLFDPLDGSSNVDIDITVGSIFSVLTFDSGRVPETADYLQPGERQVAAGYALYGPATMLVLSVGAGTHGFTLDLDSGEFVLTHPSLRIAPDAREFAINVSNARFWEPPVRRYVAACKAGAEGDFGRDYNMRWVASMVAEVHRILLRGGVYLYPRDDRPSYREGRLRLLYEASPMAMLVEQAGGRGSTGRAPLLSVRPNAIHQHVPVILGARNDVERIERFHGEFDDGVDQPFASPLFNEMSLFRPEAR